MKNFNDIANGDIKKLSIEKSFAQHLLDKKIGDVIDFGSGFKILEIKKYMSK